MSAETLPEAVATEEVTTTEIGPCNECQYLCVKQYQYRKGASNSTSAFRTTTQPECPQKGGMSDEEFLKACKASRTKYNATMYAHLTKNCTPPSVSSSATPAISHTTETKDVTPKIPSCGASCPYLCFKRDHYATALSQVSGKDLAAIKKPECPEQGDMSDADFEILCRNSRR